MIDPIESRHRKRRRRWSSPTTYTLPGPLDEVETGETPEPPDLELVLNLPNGSAMRLPWLKGRGLAGVIVSVALILLAGSGYVSFAGVTAIPTPGKSHLAPPTTLPARSGAARDGTRSTKPTPRESRSSSSPTPGLPSDTPTPTPEPNPLNVLHPRDGAVVRHWDSVDVQVPIGTAERAICVINDQDVTGSSPPYRLYEVVAGSGRRSHCTVEFSTIGHHYEISVAIVKTSDLLASLVASASLMQFPAGDLELLSDTITVVRG